METRGRGRGSGTSWKPHSKNRQWVAGQDSGSGHGGDAERWERGGHRRGRGRGRGQFSHPAHLPTPQSHDDGFSGTEDEEQDAMDEGVGAAAVDREPDSQEDREKFFQELVKGREIERQNAIADGKMTDPTKPISLNDAITLVGTCEDMCPLFERYRREREHNLSPWEVIPGTKRVDHKRAVKMYERGAGDKSLPSDLRPPLVLKRTLDYLFHDLIPRGGFSETWSFVRDRSRQVRNDFTIQHESGPIAMDCHDRCARFHILALHFERHKPGFSIAMEEQQLMHVLLSLIQFYGDQREEFTSPTELEMRVYHRLIHIRDQRHRNEDVPEEIENHPVFKLTTKFRLHVQKKSSPITKTSKLVVDSEAMEIFGQLAAVLREQNNVVMIYLVACILERLFGDDTIEEIESIRGSLEIPQIIDGIAMPTSIPPTPVYENGSIQPTVQPEQGQGPTNNFDRPASASAFNVVSSVTPQPSTIQTVNPPPAQSVFSTLTTTPNAFGSSNIFGGPVFGNRSVFSATSASGQPAPAISSFPPTTNSAFQSSGFASGSSGLVLSPDTLPAPLVNDSSSSFAPIAQPKPPLPFTNPTQPTTFSSSSNAPSTSVLNPQAPIFAPHTTPTILQPLPSAQPDGPPKPVGSSSVSQPRPTIQISPTFPPPPVQPIIDLPLTTPPATPREKPTPKIVERRQTLWEIPGTPPATPPAPTPVTPAVRDEPMSPREPPPPPKFETLSLPPTPTARWFDPSSQLPKLPDSSLLLRKQSLIGFPGLQYSAPTPAEILSPLQIPSAGSFRAPIFNHGSPSPGARPEASGFPPPVSPEKDSVVIEQESPVPLKAKTKVNPVDFRQLATEFRHGHLKKRHFTHWLKKTTDRAAYVEACARSEAYNEQVQRQRLSKSVDSVTHAKKRKVSLASSIPPSHGKRTRMRISNEYRPPQTDETLVQRLKENQDVYKRRWAQGSFLRTIQSQMRALSSDGNYPPHWCIWLSTNVENDGTAIWLDRKLDVPGAGQWVSKVVFSIPLDSDPEHSKSPESPGLILFERTPLGDIDDPIERKYRVLDDCSRLRDIVDTLRSDIDRHRYLPVLLVVSWSDPKLDDEYLDFSEMAEYLTEEGLVKAVSRFYVSSTAVDLDKEFETLLATLDLDVEDRITQTFTWNALSELFTTALRQAAADWLFSCWVGERFDWNRYGDVLRAIKESQLIVVNELLSLLYASSEVEVFMPMDMEAPAHLGQDYTLGQFLEAHIKLPIATVEQRLGEKLQDKYIFDKGDIQASLHRIETSLAALKARLRELAATAALATPLPPKRRGADAGNEDNCFTSPTSAPKRLRSSLSVVTDEDDIMYTEGSRTNGIPTSPVPSTLESTVGFSEATSQFVVTVEMLRALTRKVLGSK